MTSPASTSFMAWLMAADTLLATRIMVDICTSAAAAMALALRRFSLPCTSTLSSGSLSMAMAMPIRLSWISGLRIMMDSCVSASTVCG